jgi:hypothetical protein
MDTCNLRLAIYYCSPNFTDFNPVFSGHVIGLVASFESFGEAKG